MIDLDEIERLAREAQDAVTAFENAPRGEVPSMHLLEHSAARRAMDGLRAELSAATVLALVARLRAAEAALHPFAWAAEDLDDNESGEIWERPAAMSVECHHLRAAAAHFAAYRVLTEEPTP